ncbi:MAG: BRCT domain-containing protein [Clostridiales bacterium]|nr:BRCT domain-containing protein [Clostridiales bacterium]
MDYIIIDIETPYSLYPEDGIRELAALAVSNNEILDTLHLAIITDQEEYETGYGSGLEDIEENTEMIEKFKAFINQYPTFKIVAHNAPFEKKFLRYWKWIDENQELYCTMRAIRYKYPGLPHYKMSYLLKHFEVAHKQTHTALQDAMDLYEILKKAEPDTWIPVGVDRNNKHYDPEYERLQKEELKQRLEQARQNIINNIFNNKNVVFTGKMASDRKTMLEIATKYGAKATDSVTKKTNLLVVGEKAGSKLAKAQSLGIKIITEEEFYKLISFK